MTLSDIPPEYDPTGLSESATLSTGEAHFTPNKVLCAECQKEGEKSRVQILGSSNTLMAVWRGYDEEGNYVVRDPNKVCTHYRCSRGHEWIQGR